MMRPIDLRFVLRLLAAAAAVDACIVCIDRDLFSAPLLLSFELGPRLVHRIWEKNTVSEFL
jgi:hypothetical protein